MIKGRPQARGDSPDSKRTDQHNRVEEKYHPDTVLKKNPCTVPMDKIIVIGSSTGGTEALNTIFSSLPGGVGIPPIVVVQHIPKMFSSSLTERLNSNSKLGVYEVTRKMFLHKDCIYIASGDKHVILGHELGRYFARQFDGNRVSRHKPSVDILFRSANNICGANTMAIILTGMGDDGSIGIKELHDSGAYTLAQDKDSCVVFGMPKKAIEAGAIKEVVPLELISRKIVDFSAGRIQRSNG